MRATCLWPLTKCCSCVRYIVPSTQNTIPFYISFICQLLSHEWTIYRQTNIGFIDWVRFNVPPNSYMSHRRRVFTGQNDPTNSVKALKEDRFLGLGFNPSGPPDRVTIIQQLAYVVWNNNTQNTQTNTNKSMHSEMGQWDKTQSTEL